MSRAIGMTLVFLLVVMLGTHPGTTVDLFQQFLGVIQRAGNELASFVSDL